MKSRTSRQRVYGLLRSCRYLFFIPGILVLSYAAFVWLDARRFQEEQTRVFADQLKALAESKRDGAEIPAVIVRNGAPVGRIEIRTVGLAAIILEGVEDKTLRRAVGHIPGTALPGQQGNVALAGHRDTFFRGLREIRDDDDITLTTSAGSYRYRVESRRVVEPEAIEVLDSSPRESILTLVTCYPFDLVGAAPRRFIVRARMLPESETRDL